MKKSGSSRVFNVLPNKHLNFKKKAIRQIAVLTVSASLFSPGYSHADLSNSDVQTLWVTACGVATVVDVLNYAGAENIIGNILLGTGIGGNLDTCMRAHDAAMKIRDKNRHLCQSPIIAEQNPNLCGGNPIPDPEYPSGGPDRDVRQPSGVKSPLVINFNGLDVIETKGVEGEIYFDHDANGSVDRTGWINGLAGFLVLDLNNDGIINTGRELFGDSMLLVSGEVAENGFLALKEYDLDSSNTIDSNDAVFYELKVWIDFLPDGISDTFEMFDFSELNMQSIDLNYGPGSGVDINLNDHRQRSLVTLENGEQRAIEDIWFVVNDDFSPLVVPDDIAQLPNAMGVGNVRSLRQTLVLDQYGDLYNAVSTYLASTPDQRNANLTNLVHTWVAVNNDTTTASGFDVLEAFWGAPGYLDGKENAKSAAKRKIAAHYANLMDVIHFQLSSKTYLKNLFYDFNAFEKDATTSSGFMTNFEAVASEIKHRILFDNDGTAVNLFDDFIRALRGINTETEEFKQAFLDAFIQNTDVLATDDADILNLNQYYLGLQTAGLTNDQGISVETGNGDDLIQLDSGNLTISSGEGNDQIYSGHGNDFIQADAGHDVINAGSGNDTIFAGEGDDEVVISYQGNNVLYGGAGDDTLRTERIVFGKNGHGTPALSNNTFNGGTGNDRLEGWAGTDTYQFNRGDGQDVINDFGGVVYTYTYKNRNRGGTNVSSAVDRIVFGEGILADELNMLRQDDHLIISFGLSAGDQITIENWFASKKYRIEEFVFVDGTILMDADISTKVIQSQISEGNDVVQGWGVDLEINTLAGDDTITVVSGNIILNAGEGNDQIALGTGDDVISAGPGNDIVSAGSGNNTVNAGDGDDQITTEGGSDAIHAGAGDDNINSGAGDDTVYAGEGDDEVVIPYQGNNVLYGGAGDDTLRTERIVFGKNGHGTPALSNNTFNGGTGNDRLEGWAGTDTYQFNRGDGQDVINDFGGVVYTYTYKNRNRGGTNVSSAVDRIVFGEGILADELNMLRQDDHLIISFGLSAGDQITIENWFASNLHLIEELAFVDGQILSSVDVDAMVQPVDE